ncbi:MAG: hypothetical protein PUA56_06735 [Bacillales bacterium]|nr:hypothetical protein [Bacillales bacterium]
MVFLVDVPPYAYGLIIAALAGVIALIVFLLKKYVPSLKNVDEVKDDQTIAEENVQSKIMTLDEENPLKDLEDDE